MAGQDEVINAESEIVEEVEQETTETAEDSEEIIITIDGESPPQEEDDNSAPEWVKGLRKDYKALSREKHEWVNEKRKLEEQLKAITTEKPVALGPKPKLSDCDFDDERFEQALTDWHERKRDADTQAAQARAAEESQQKAWNDKVNSYNDAKAKLKLPDFDEAEENVKRIFSVTQQGILLKGSKDPALSVYALGNMTNKAKELSAITDPIEFAFAAGRLEKEMKVERKKQTPPPEKTVSGNARISGGVDSTLERLRADAAKTGDYTKVTQYKRQKASK